MDPIVYCMRKICMSMKNYVFEMEERKNGREKKKEKEKKTGERKKE